MQLRDNQVHDCQKRVHVGECNADIRDHSTKTTQIFISLGDSWNIPREEIELFPDREIGCGVTGLVLEGYYQTNR